MKPQDPETQDAPRRRGLPSIEQARQARGKLRFPPAKFWGWIALILAITAILEWKWDQGKLESQRAALLAKQRAVAVELGPKWFALRDKVEHWTQELAKSPDPEVVDRDALAGWDFREKAGLYLRLRVDEANTSDDIRAHAKDSLRDAFTACLMRVPNPNPLAGAECKRTRDCAAGEFCNETDHCSRPAQPYNLRVAYRTMHVLSDDWMHDVQDASAELRIRVLAASFEETMRDDIPLAVDLLTRAQYFLLVLDEMPAGALPDAGNVTEFVHAQPHGARVAVWRLSDGKLLLRVRRDAGGELIGGTPSLDEEVLAARKRQANSCALALAVRQAIGDRTASAP